MSFMDWVKVKMNFVLNQRTLDEDLGIVISLTHSLTHYLFILFSSR